MSTALILRGVNDPAVTVNAEAVAQRDESLALAALVSSVETPEQQSSSVVVLQDLKGWVKQVETARTQLKRPVLDLGKSIDSAAETFLAEVLAEIARINRLVTGYQEAELRKQREAERKQAEALRLAEEARAKAEREELARTDAKLREAKTEVERDTALKAEETRLRQLDVETAKAKAAILITPPAAAPKAEGLRVREVWVPEVVDIHQLYLARPELVTLTPKLAEINRAIGAGLRECPGLRITQQVKTGVVA